jgi:ABC-type transporter Mla subunit MlaD
MPTDNAILAALRKHGADDAGLIDEVRQVLKAADKESQALDDLVEKLKGPIIAWLNEKLSGPINDLKAAIAAATAKGRE